MSKRAFDPDKVRGVIFDAFGTLVHIGNPRRPYRRLLDLAARSGRAPRPDDGAKVMSMNCGLAEFAEWLQLDLTEADLRARQFDLAEEIASVTMFPESRATIDQLRASGLTIGICSNLAAPYAAPIHRLLPGVFDTCIWSFAIGAVKPAPAIYEAVCEAIGLAPDELLFVGDTYEADVAGPRHYGMQAIHLARDGQSPDDRYLRELGQLLTAPHSNFLG